MAFPYENSWKRVISLMLWHPCWLDFMFSGPAEMCNPESELHLEANAALFIAPTMAYFANTIDTISAIYFISKEKFIIFFSL